MSKLNHFLLISVLVIVALVFGISGGVDAKFWPNCPSEGIHNQGPAIRAHFDFLLNATEDLMVSGSCKNITVEPELIGDIEWIELDIDEDGLDKADLKGNIFQITNSDPLWGIMVECYGLDPLVDMTICLKIVSVSNFTDNGDGTYSADVILLRVIT